MVMKMFMVEEHAFAFSQKMSQERLLQYYKFPSAPRPFLHWNFWSIHFASELCQTSQRHIHYYCTLLV
jgi:hypothetical protein